MPSPHLPRPKEGDILSEDFFDRYATAIEERLRITVAEGSGLGMTTGPAGTTITYDRSWEGWIKLTAHGSAEKYAWTEQVPTSAGGWTNGKRAGTTTVDPAHEVNGLTTVSTASNNVVRAWRATANNRLYFQSDLCA